MIAQVAALARGKAVGADPAAAEELRIRQVNITNEMFWYQGRNMNLWTEELHVKRIRGLFDGGLMDFITIYGPCNYMYSASMLQQPLVCADGEESITEPEAQEELHLSQVMTPPYQIYKAQANIQHTTP